MSRFPLLARPAADASRELARVLVRRANRQATRLGAPDDAEALHDFRVALRRLRTFLRAYSECMPISAKVRRELARLSRRTSEARDVEVASEWLRRQWEALDERQRPALKWLFGRLNEGLEVPGEGGGAAERWDVLVRKLERRLRADDAAGRPPKPFGRVAETVIRNACTRLEKRLARVQSVSDQEPAHRARVAAKRLRYLLEPVAETVPAADIALKRLKALQDHLGGMHDMDVVLEMLRDAMRDATKVRAERMWAMAEVLDGPVEAWEAVGELEPGLVQLIALARHTQRDLFDAMRNGELADGGETLLNHVRQCAAELGVENHGSTGGTDIALAG